MTIKKRWGQRVPRLRARQGEAGHYPGDLTDGQWLSARGIPAACEYELRTSPAMLITDRLVGGGSFTELQALNFRDGVVEMGHDGPAHWRSATAS